MGYELRENFKGHGAEVFDVSQHLRRIERTRILRKIEFTRKIIEEEGLPDIGDRLEEVS